MFPILLPQRSSSRGLRRNLPVPNSASEGKSPLIETEVEVSDEAGSFSSAGSVPQFVNADCVVVLSPNIPSSPPPTIAATGESSSFDAIYSPYKGARPNALAVSVPVTNFSKNIQVARQIANSDDEGEYSIALTRRSSMGKPKCLNSERWYGFNSSHVLMNCERKKRGLEPLVRRQDLDEAARTTAEAMAKKGSATNKNRKKNPFQKMKQMASIKKDNNLHNNLRTQLGLSANVRIGENVAKGTSILDIHKKMMSKTSKNRRNMLDENYSHVGMATAKGKSGKSIYICQIFLE
mmetsp:Transcript_18547/g.28629  ORF Transcript_18547/g.28629 Transcript_18547/m.28629 type:complete len:293 (+) Transcript_18547:223-1101(+)